MIAEVNKDGPHIVIRLKGYLSFENTSTVKNYLEEIYRREKEASVIIDLSDLEFVGSSGISQMVKKLLCFNQLKNKPTYTGLRQEFTRIFKVFEEEAGFEIFENTEEAKQKIRLRSLGVS